MSADHAIARIETELPGWAWSLFARVPGEDYQAKIWECGDTPEVELQVYAEAATPGGALVEALERVKRGDFYTGR